MTLSRHLNSNLLGFRMGCSKPKYLQLLHSPPLPPIPLQTPSGVDRTSWSYYHRLREKKWELLASDTEIREVGVERVG